MKPIKKVILLGSGGLSIGQAGEFDYSGCQAIRSLEEEGVQVVIVNPNIATVQTTLKEGRKIYLYPVEPEWVEKVILAEKPDGLIAGFGGQTALNCAIRLDESGVLARHGLQNLGTAIEVLRLTEDRDLFAQAMKSQDIPVPPSQAAASVSSALRAADRIGYPVIVRAAYALGGLGSGFAQNSSELKYLVEGALASSPQVLVEKSLWGWKEVEYEVMRDSFGNIITICNMENFDPLGVHTGDSIVVAPSQTLTDEEYQLLRTASLKIVESLKVVGECNVQFALNPQSLEFYVIEVNARLSRSSALASKATGYPIALVAAKVVLGKSLLEIKNPLTGNTTAFFEPALDYIAIKIPKWDLKKFRGVSREIGTTMKSIGEVMAIGRSFAEALQKGIRMVTENESGWIGSTSSLRSSVVSSPLRLVPKDWVEELKVPTDARLFKLIEALRQGFHPNDIYQVTQIDRWFLNELAEIVATEREIRELGLKWQKRKPILEESLASVSRDSWRCWKSKGFSDEAIARLCSGDAWVSKANWIMASLVVRKLRQQAGVNPVIKKIDTSAGEFPSSSNYLYLTYSGEISDEVARKSGPPSALLLGGGSYRIGSSVEFDWCAVSCLEKLRELGWSTSVVNHNPETVSTDFDLSDQLFFEELSLERILDIVEFEKPAGVIVSMSGQLPNILAPQLASRGIPLLGHAWQSIDQAEDRKKFSALLDCLKIDQPQWIEATSVQSIKDFIAHVGFPILVRPSYVLSGAAMSVAIDESALMAYLSRAREVSTDYPVILSQYFEGAQEVELDAVAQRGQVLVSAISEHIENAGVHSGDATLIFPAQNLSETIKEKIAEIGKKLAHSLELNGPFNSQFLIKDGRVLVIECNVRASRSFPFVSKVLGLDLIGLATEAMVSSEEIPPFKELVNSKLVGVKSAMFSFQRLAGADPVLGVEMASTGEVACLGSTVDEALLLSFQSSGLKPPQKGVLISGGRIEEKKKLIESVKILNELGVPVFATPGSANFFRQSGLRLSEVSWDSIAEKMTELIQNNELDFVINIPKDYSESELSFGYRVRTLAVRRGCTLMTNVEKTERFLKALASKRRGEIRESVSSLDLACQGFC